MITERRRLEGHAAMLLFSVLIAGSFSLGSLIAPTIDPAALTAARFLAAGIVIGAIAVAGPGFRTRDFRAPWRFGVLGGLFAVYFVLMFEGLKTASPVSTAAVFTLVPLMSAMFGRMLLGQIASRRMIIALAVGGVGALWVIFRGSLSSLVSLDIGRGEAIFLVGALAHALYVPMIPKLNRGESPLVFTFGMMVAGFVILLAYGWRPILATDWAGMPPFFWAVFAYLVFFASASTFYLVQFASLRLPSGKVMAYTYLTPAWVIVWEGSMGHGWVSLSVLGGTIATLLALFLLLKDDDRHRGVRPRV